MRLRSGRERRHLGEFWASPALLDDIRHDPAQHIVAEPRPLPFDESGDLTDREPGPARVRVAPSTSSDAW